MPHCRCTSRRVAAKDFIVRRRPIWRHPMAPSSGAIQAVRARYLAPGAVLAAIALFAAAPARAEWLERAWDDETVGETGGPAVTLTPIGISLVLPERVLSEARAAGVSEQNAVQRFIQRYGQHCSEILDLDRPHHGLKVKLFTLKAVPLEDASEQVQGDVLDALKAPGGKRPPHVDTLFVVSDEPREMTIDYVPERRANCVRPDDPSA